MYNVYPITYPHEYPSFPICNSETYPLVIFRLCHKISNHHPSSSIIIIPHKISTPIVTIVLIPCPHIFLVQYLNSTLPPIHIDPYSYSHFFVETNLLTLIWQGRQSTGGFFFRSSPIIRNDSNLILVIDSITYIPMIYFMCIPIESSKFLKSYLGDRFHYIYIYYIYIHLPFMIHSHSQWIGWEKIQETPKFHGKNRWFPFLGRSWVGSPQWPSVRPGELGNTSEVSRFWSSLYTWIYDIINIYIYYIIYIYM